MCHIMKPTHADKDQFNVLIPRKYLRERKEKDRKPEAHQKNEAVLSKLSKPLVDEDESVLCLAAVYRR